MPRPGRPTTERAKDFKGTLRQLIRTMSHYKLPLAAAMLFAVLSTIFNIAGPKVLAKATTALATGWIARLRGTGSIDFVYIGRILLFLLGMYLLSSAFSFIQGWLMTGLSQKVCYDFRRQISEKINRLPLAYFEKRTVGEVLSRITNDVDTLGQSLNQSITQLITSVTTLYYTAQANITKFMNWANHLEFIEKNEQITELLNSAYAALNTNLDTWNTWLKNTLLPSMQNILSGAAIGVLNVVTVAKNLIIGIIVAVYMLASRKRFVQQGKLVLHSIVRPRWAQLITEEVKYADRMFGGFINGKIMDSAIIGVLCYIGCLIFKFPSALLVSVIIGVTNVIPFFGPFIGAVPATLLILIQSPIKALWFVLFVLVLQQLDGNIIGPKILGNTTGLSSFWVLFAILLFGGLWGFVGMIVGVPLFAVIYDVIKKLVIHGLQRNQELTLLNSYHDQFGDPTDDAAAQPAAPQPAENQ